MRLPKWLRYVCAVGNTVGLALGFAGKSHGLVAVNALGLFAFAMIERVEAGNGR